MKLYYIYDALCGWCYGFSAVMKSFYEKVQEELPLEVISGGMILGDREGPIGNMAPYIKKAYKVVEERSGVKFGQPYLDRLDEGTLKLTSLPPAKAMAAYKLMKDTGQLDFAHAIQTAMKFHGKDLSDESVYLEIADTLKINKKTFLHHLHSPVAEEVALQDFNLTQQLQVQGFPSVIMADENKHIMIAHGFTPEDQLMINYERGKEMLMKP